MGLLDPNWKYTPSTATDIRKTFEKARRELSKQERLQKGQKSSSAKRSGSLANVLDFINSAQR